MPTETVHGAGAVGKIHHGSCYGDHIGWSQATAAQNFWYNIIDADMVSGLLENVTHDGNGKLTVTEAGHYEITYSLTYEDDTANDHVEAGIEVSGGGSAEAAGVTHSEVKFASQEQSLSGTCILDLAAGATLEVCIRTTDANTPLLSVQDVNLVAMLVGTA